MMYPYMTFHDDTEVTHSQMLDIYRNTSGRWIQESDLYSTEISV